MRLELSDHQADVLRDHLETAISNLQMEISHTDAPVFRERLRDERDALRAVREALTAATAR